jgi:Lon protease-like protein
MTVLAMFPLGRVLFPHEMLSLHVFEPRYRLMIRQVMAGDREFGVVLIERGSEVGGGDTRFGVATVARVVRAVETPDGRFAVTAVGTRRVQVVRWLADDPYPQADVVALAEDAGPVAEHEPARQRVHDSLERLVAVARRVDPAVAAPAALATDPTTASYEVAAVSTLGALDAQRVLEAPDAVARLGLLATALDERAEDLRARLALDE